MTEKEIYEDWLCCMYDEDGNIHWGYYDSNWYPRITHQMACAWLREVHNKHMQIAYGTYGWYYDIIDLKEVSVYDSFTDVKCWYDAGGFDTYEEAVESALKYTLENLI